jgi:2,3,4,5-tetrahydropyridine-2-carboxylate N-succinyltransferase
VPIYDIVNKTIVKGEIPENAVVVPGTRTIKSNPWAKAEGLQLGCAIIVKYRDNKTDAATVLEDLLRS